MSRWTLTITPRSRDQAKAWIDRCKDGWTVEVRDDARSNEQNAKLWPMLTDIARQVEWHGIRLTPEDWKLIFLEGLTQEMRIVPNLNGNGFVNLGRSSSRLSKSEFSDLIELIYAFGSERGVEWSEPRAANDPGTTEEAA